MHAWTWNSSELLDHEQYTGTITSGQGAQKPCTHNQVFILDEFRTMITLQSYNQNQRRAKQIHYNVVFMTACVICAQTFSYGTKTVASTSLPMGRKLGAD